MKDEREGKPHTANEQRDKLRSLAASKNLCPRHNGAGRAGKCTREKGSDSHECVFCGSTKHGALDCPQGKARLKELE